MSLISIASSFAIVLGFAGTIPHISTMVRTRSSAGQSSTGWFIGIAVNVMTGYVNLAGSHSIALGVGNVIAATFNLIALACVVRYRAGAGPESQLALAAPSAAALTALAGQPSAYHELPTSELVAIKSEIDREHERRESLTAVL